MEFAIYRTRFISLPANSSVISVQYVPVRLTSVVIAKYRNWTANQQIANFLRNSLLIFTILIKLILLKTIFLILLNILLLCFIYKFFYISLFRELTLLVASTICQMRERWQAYCPDHDKSLQSYFYTESQAYCTDVPQQLYGCVRPHLDSHETHRERKCAVTIGTVLVPWAGHFQC